MVEHTVRAHGEALDKIAQDIARMGEAAVRQVADALSAVTRTDAALARDVIARDAELDRLEAAIDHDVIVTIARRHPMAQDLRQILAAMKIAGNLERCGDLAKGVAQRALAAGGTPLPEQLQKDLQRLGRLALDRLDKVVKAYASADESLARAVWRGDTSIDDAFATIFRELVEQMSENAELVAAGANFLFVAKNLERIGDHATNIAELVVYQATGEEIAQLDRPRGGTE
jgi:phosphate transport system protein